MNLDTLIQHLQNHIDRNELVKADVAKKIGVSPSGLSHLLSRKVNPTGEQALEILNLTKGNKSKMNTNNTQTSDTGLEIINFACAARYRNAGKNIKSFQTTSNDGWLPGVTDEPSLAESVAELIRDGRIKEATDLLVQIQKSPRVTPSTAPRASVNRGGSTQLPQNATDAGFSKKLDELKKELGMKRDAAIKATHKPVEKKIEFSGDIVSAKTVDIEKVKQLHTARLESAFEAPEGSVLHAKKIEEKLLSNRNNENFEKMMSLRANLNQFAI